MDTQRRPDRALPKSICVERTKRAAVAFHISTLGTSRVLVTLLAVGLGRADWSPKGSSVPHVRLCSVQLQGLVSSCEANPWVDGTQFSVFCKVYPEPLSTA